MILALEIIGYIIAGLIGIPVLLSTIRAISGSRPVKWAVSLIPHFEAKAASEGYFHRLAVALDIFANVFLWLGYEDETISSHAYRASLEGKLWGKVMTAWLNLWQENHGQQAASGDLERAQSEVTRLQKLLGD